jgi:uncharacterized membrane protein
MLLLALATCGEKEDPVNTDVCKGLEHITGVTWTSDVERITRSSCVECHCSRDVGCDRHNAPSNATFDDYETAAFYAQLMAVKVGSGIMPPPSEINGSSIVEPTQEDRCRIVVWAREGALLE